VNTMADPTQFTFSWRDVAASLLKQQGIREGKWLIGLQFGFAAVNVGPGPSEVLPSAIVGAQQLQLTRLPADAEVSALVVDAGQANAPERASTPRRKPRKTK